jgi:hypothetical protein
MSCCCCESDMRHLRFFRKPPGRDAHGERGYVASRPGQSARFVVQLLVRASRLLLWAGATVVAVSLRTNLEPAQAHLRPSMMARPAPHHRPVNVCRHADRRAVQLPSRPESLDRTTIFHPGTWPHAAWARCERSHDTRDNRCYVEVCHGEEYVIIWKGNLVNGIATIKKL